MIVTDGIISMAEGGLYRVKIGGCISALIPAVGSAYKLQIDFEEKTFTKKPPAVGDAVLCFFPGDGYSAGYVLGILEG